MKLLFDQILSWPLPRNLEDIFPESIHLREISFTEAEVKEIGDYVKGREQIVKGMTVNQIKDLSNKYLDADKMIWLVVGDAKTQLPRMKELGFGEPILINNGCYATDWSASVLACHERKARKNVYDLETRRNQRAFSRRSDTQGQQDAGAPVIFSQFA